MTRICHVLDESIGWEQRIAVSQLLNRLDSALFNQRVVTTDRSVVKSFQSLDIPIEVMTRWSRFSAMSSPSLKQFVQREKIDLIHAWSPQAAMAARAAGDIPIVIELFDPLIATRDIKLIRTISKPRHFAVVCSCEIIRRRLVEGGLPLQQTVVVRPGIDFGLISKLKRNPIRRELGIESDDFVIVVPEPNSPDSPSRDVLSAASLMNFYAKDLRVIVPGQSRGQARINRLHDALPVPNTIVCPGDSYSMEQLIAISDCLVVATRGDLSTTCIAWAMACKTAIIGTAVHAVAELIANKLNGLLFKQTPGKSMILAIAKCLKDRESLNKVKETAHGQAYEVFGLRRCIDQHIKLYENVLSGITPAEGITDPAMAM